MSNGEIITLLSRPNIHRYKCIHSFIEEFTKNIANITVNCGVSSCMYTKKSVYRWNFLEPNLKKVLKKDLVKVCLEYNFQSEFLEEEFAIILEARGDWIHLYVITLCIIYCTAL